MQLDWLGLMKNKFKTFLLLLIFFFPINKTFSNDIKFEAKEIIIKENGNLIEAKNETKIEASNGVEIKSDKFSYDKIKSIAYIKGNVTIFDLKNNIYITGDSFVYFKNDEKIISENIVKINIDEKYFVQTDNIEYLIVDKTILSNKN